MKELQLKKDEQCRVMTEYWKAYFSKRAYALENRFYSDFYVQCAESTAADVIENFLENRMEHNFFRAHMDKLDEAMLCRFFKLAGIHHTLRIMRRRQKEVSRDGLRAALFAVYQLNAQEQQMTEILECCIFNYQTGFQYLFHKITARYVFGSRALSPFSFAFIGNFWYNSYSSFMGAFCGYVPFHIRMKRAAG